ncbi:transcription termination factor MTERF5, chloroplastic-like isoform X1 [Cucumis sativus]|uniref:transcription termination factor MTERF5, chloroplastic-like isoform X1 n=1 Tax=Cucumis sativus TaxID=3659 RepID=UPI0012F4BF31|nr:transcription termination factor MTERF5, chloroplastic-like isoform X1 [Cucumis sativus]KAE8648667.1 hypothetical protein Csa_007838 [Cucumis sativus]
MFKISSTFLLHFIHKRSLNTVSTSTLPLPSVSTIQFLTNSCGLSSGSPTSKGRKLQFDGKSIQKYEAIIGFLKSHGFENSQIAKLVSKQPSILQSKVSNNLKPKFEFLQEVGFVGPLLPKLILSNPGILIRSLDSQLKPTFFILKEILGEKGNSIKNSCGLSTESPSSAGRKLRIDEKNIQQYEAIVGFFKSHGFENSQIAKLVSRQPSILQSTVSTNLKPKFEFLQENGFVGPLLPKLILSNPGILIRSLDSQLKPTFRLIKEMLESDVKVTTAICRSTWLLTSNSKGPMRSNIDVLVSEGVPSRNIGKMIELNPRTITLNVDRMIDAVKTVKELGVEPKDRKFVLAVSAVVSRSDSAWKKKINVMKSLGWSEKEILTAFKRYPPFFNCSEEKMRDVADFCFNTAKLDPGTLIRYPVLFKYSVDKRLRPRYKVLEVLKVKNLLKNEKSAQLFFRGEREFVENYIVKHLDEIPNLMDIYRGNVASETKSVL